MLFIELNRLNLTQVFSALSCALAEKDNSEDIPNNICVGAVDALIEMAQFCIEKSSSSETLFQIMAGQIAPDKHSQYADKSKKLILERALKGSSENCAKYNIMDMLCRTEGQINLFWANYFLATRTRKIYYYYKWLESLAIIEINVVGQSPFEVNLTNIINKMSQEVAERVSRETNFINQYNRKLEDLYIQKGLKLTPVDDKKEAPELGAEC